MFDMVINYLLFLVIIETKKDDVIKNREEPDGGVENTHSAGK